MRTNELQHLLILFKFKNKYLLLLNNILVDLKYNCTMKETGELLLLS